MHELIAGATGSNWTAGSSIMTFYFPIGLFAVIIGLLYLQFGRPHTVPGRAPLPAARPAAHDVRPTPDQPAKAGADDQPSVTGDPDR